MSFPRGPRRGPIPTRARGVVLAVGRRVSVRSTDGVPARVTLMDAGDASVGRSLVDGAEVEIVGWRPSGSRGVRYQVRATRDGLEGWVAEGSLRDPTTVAPPTTFVSERLQAPAAMDTGRRFGQR
jgi:hypothetical protein